jgi:hypothetical protein
MALPFTWPGKKEGSEPSGSSSKLEFPEALAAQGPPELKPKSESPHAAGKDDAADLRDLTARYGQLSMLMEQANQQVLAYLIERQSQADAKPADSVSKKLEACMSKLELMAVGSAGTIAEKFDALAGKLDKLSVVGAPASGASTGGAAPVGDAAIKTALQPLHEKLDHIDAKFKALNEKAAAIDALKEAFIPTLVKLRDGLSEQHAALGGGIRQVQQQFDEGLRVLDATLQMIAAHFQPQSEPASGPATSGQWEYAILGNELAEQRGVDQQRQRLLNGVIEGDPAACALVGNLLVFRSVAAEKMPTLLKDVGEAYYRWSPRGGRDDEFEKALVAYLQRACEQAGMSNTIELVHPGERYDSTRHNASERGVEITQVFGWIVLRDNGKVYTKASVAVK